MRLLLVFSGEQKTLGESCRRNAGRFGSQSALAHGKADKA
jgi:hypothetical protein